MQFITSTFQALGPRPRQEDAIGYNASVWVVCDGMGGHPRGDEASKAARDAILSSDTSDFYEVIPAAYAAVAGLGARFTSRNPGTTCTAVKLLPDGKALLVHVGDSRCYHFVGATGALRCLTTDHVDADWGTLQRCITVRADCTPDMIEFTVVPGDCVLLCSDGFWGGMEHTCIKEMLQHRLPFDTDLGILQDNASAIRIEVVNE